MSKYIYGVHDRGDWEKVIQAAGITAWCVYTEAVGADPSDRSGKDYRHPFLTPVIRLNNGYGEGVGTIPTPDKYAAFAQRCANFVANSQGIEYVVIGNEIGLPWEWPVAGQPLTLATYVECYRQVYDAIKAVAPQVRMAPQAPAPWNDKTPDAPDWIMQLATMLTMLASRVDWICLHAYSWGYSPETAFATGAKMGSPYAHRHSGWETLWEYMGIIPQSFRQLPVLCTEVNGNGPWPSHNNGWVQAMYQQIDQWNNRLGNQQIGGACLFRWSRDDVDWRLTLGALDGFGQAVQQRYQWTVDSSQRREGSGAVGMKAGDKARVVAGTVNVRNAPGLNAPIIAQICQGTVLVISQVAEADGLTWLGYPQGWVAEVAPDGIRLVAFADATPAAASRAGGETTPAAASRAGGETTHAAASRAGGETTHAAASRAGGETTMGSSIEPIVRKLAGEYGLDERLARAVIAVESGGVGLVNGKPITRFEPHVFLSEFNRLFRDYFAVGDPSWDGARHRLADNGRWATFHGDQAAERRALRTAVEIAAQAAYNSASYGLGQIMGFNYAACGYESAESMQTAFTSEEAQIRAMFDYMKTSGALAKLQAGDIEGFAAIYNGPANVAHYSALIRQKLGA